MHELDARFRAYRTNLLAAFLAGFAVLLLSFGYGDGFDSAFAVRQPGAILVRMVGIRRGAGADIDRLRAIVFDNDRRTNKKQYT